MEKIINFIKKPVVWIVSLVLGLIGGVFAWLFKTKRFPFNR